MLRIKFPGGGVTSEQLRLIGRLAERYGRGMGDITTRQNIQLHNLTIEDLPVVLDELNAVGLSFTQACGDVWRNIVGCPLAGVDGHELLDTRPLIEELERVFVGNREFSNLPRKFKVSVSAPAPTAARSTRSTTSGWSRSRRTASSATTCGSAADSAPRRGWAGGWTCSSRRTRRSRSAARSPSSSATRASAPSGHARGSSSWSTSGASSASAPRSRTSWAASCRRRSTPAEPIDPHRDHLGIHPQASTASTTSAAPRCAAGSWPTR